MVDQFEGPGEVDFPAWWQSKITNAASMISSAKHYLEFELKEPAIDAMVGVAQSEDVIDENKINALEEIKAKVLEKLTAKTPMKTYIKDFAKSDAPQFKGKTKEKKRQMAVAAKLSKEK
jgi:ribosomal protein S1